MALHPHTFHFPGIHTCVFVAHIFPFVSEGESVKLVCLQRFFVRESGTGTFIMKVLEEVPAVKIRCVTTPVGWRLLQTVAGTPDSSCSSSSAAVK